MVVQAWLLRIANIFAFYSFMFCISDDYEDEKRCSVNKPSCLYFVQRASVGRILTSISMSISIFSRRMNRLVYFASGNESSNWGFGIMPSVSCRSHFNCSRVSLTAAFFSIRQHVKQPQPH